MLGGGKGWAGLCGGGHSTGQVDRRQIQTQTARAVERVVGGRDRESTVSEIILPFRLYPAPPRPLVGQLHTPLDLFHLSPSPRQPPPEPVHVSPSPPSDDEDDLAHNPLLLSSTSPPSPRPQAPSSGQRPVTPPRRWRALPRPSSQWRRPAPMCHLPRGFPRLAGHQGLGPGPCSVGGSGFGRMLRKLCRGPADFASSGPSPVGLKVGLSIDAFSPPSIVSSYFILLSAHHTRNTHICHLTNNLLIVAECFPPQSHPPPLKEGTPVASHRNARHSILRSPANSKFSRPSSSPFLMNITTTGTSAQPRCHHAAKIPSLTPSPTSPSSQSPPSPRKRTRPHSTHSISSPILFPPLPDQQQSITLVMIVRRSQR